MKITKKLILFLIVGLGLVLAGQAKAEDTLVFTVSGNCDMCKETIEGSVNVKGVSYAEWDSETGKIKVVYDPAKISEEKIHQLIAAAGYETDKIPASADAYKKLHKCCQYEKKLHK